MTNSSHSSNAPAGRRRVRPLHVGALVAFALAGSAFFGTSCATPVDSLVFLGEVNDGGGTFGSDDADAAAPSPGAHVDQCIATTCPDGFATCSDGTGPAYKCGSELRADPNNCGACGNKCLHYERIHLTSRCIEGTCELECWNPYNPAERREWRECDGKIDNGCESDILTNPKHCGACGNECASGEPCVEGKCGCPDGQRLCDGACVDTQTDDWNCGKCGVHCDREDGACTLPDSAYYGCQNGICQQPKCGFMLVDCNGDLADPSCNTDGCEVTSNLVDDANCGKCGNRCNVDAGEHCVQEGSGPECAVPCVRFGKVDCGMEGCRDLLNDPEACGSCSRACPSPGANQEVACRKGLCQLDCVTGFADCNGDPADGCEVNLMAHPGNCGACGNACDIAAGQPCVAGQCLMGDCAPGAVQ